MSIDSIRSTGISYQQATANPKPEAEKNATEAKTTVKATQEKATEHAVLEGNKRETQEMSIQEESRKASVDAVKKAVAEMNKTSTNKTVQFGLHEETNRMTIKILDSGTRKVIKEFPAERTLDLIAKAWEMAGMMFDEKR